MPFQDLINVTKVVDEKFIDDQMVGQLYNDVINNPKYLGKTKNPRKGLMRF